MIKLILVRHGRTNCNESGVLSGLTDSILSEKGKEQSIKLVQYLKNENINRIYTTPFSRTRETVKKLAEIKNIKIEEKSQFNEINFGDFEGLSFKEIEKKYPEEIEKMMNEGFEYKYPNGESLIDTFNRVKNEVNRIVNDDKNLTVLICSHGGTIRNIISYLLCGNYKYHWNFRIDNCSITEIEVDNNFAVINKLNDKTYFEL